jgi:hypothetical protein
MRSGMRAIDGRDLPDTYFPQGPAIGVGMESVMT